VYVTSECSNQLVRIYATRFRLVLSSEYFKNIIKGDLTDGFYLHATRSGLDIGHYSATKYTVIKRQIKTEYKKHHYVLRGVHSCTSLLLQDSR
jgi:hypothetical protein